MPEITQVIIALAYVTLALKALGLI